MINDGFGYAGLIIDYALVGFFSSGAALLFLYFWKKGKLDFGQEAATQMIEEDNDGR